MTRSSQIYPKILLAFSCLSNSNNTGIALPENISGHDELFIPETLKTDLLSICLSFSLLAVPTTNLQHPVQYSVFSLVSLHALPLENNYSSSSSSVSFPNPAQVNECAAASSSETYLFYASDLENECSASNSLISHHAPALVF